MTIGVRRISFLLLSWVGLWVGAGPAVGADVETPPPWPGDAWRRERRIIDLHQHIGASEDYARRALGILDRSGVGVAVNLSGGTVTSTTNQPSEFERWSTVSQKVAPGRWLPISTSTTRGGMNRALRNWQRPKWTPLTVWGRLA